MTEICQGCKASLVAMDGPTHRYLGASPACWQIYTRLLAGGSKVEGSGQYGDLLVDAYAAQHPGTDSPQARQSMAVHLVTLWAVLREAAEVDKAIDIRVRVVSVGRKTGGFEWLEPAPESYPLTVAGLNAAESIDATSMDLLVVGVLGAWSANHETAIRRWYERYRQGFRG